MRIACHKQIFCDIRRCTFRSRPRRFRNKHEACHVVNLPPSLEDNIAMVVLFDKPIPPIGPSSSAAALQRPSSSSSSRLLPPLPAIPALSQSIVATNRLLPRSAPSRRRPLPATKDLQSKINLLDLPTETTATIFRYAHKPKDFHFLLPSGAGPLTLRPYNLPLTVSKEWYRRARPIYYEILRLAWRRIPDFIESVQQYDGLGRCISGVHVKISGKSFYKVIKGGRRGRCRILECAVVFVDWTVY